MTWQSSWHNAPPVRKTTKDIHREAQARGIPLRGATKRSPTIEEILNGIDSPIELEQWNGR